MNLCTNMQYGLAMRPFSDVIAIVNVDAYESESSRLAAIVCCFSTMTSHGTQSLITTTSDSMRWSRRTMRACRLSTKLKPTFVRAVSRMVRKHTQTERVFSNSSSRTELSFSCWLAVCLCRDSCIGQRTLPQKPPPLTTIHPLHRHRVAWNRAKQLHTQK